MAALPQNTTTRLFYDYVTGSGATGTNHTIAQRIFGTTANIADAQLIMLAVLNAVTAAQLRAGWRILQVRYQAAGTNFSTPVALSSALALFEGTSAGGWDYIGETREWTFQGRSPTSGRKVDFSLYGVTATAPDNFRVAATFEPNNWVANVLAVLNDADNGSIAFTSVDGSRALWYGYANWQHNSYWEQEFRS